jgi:nicotinamidase-related amidase
MSETDLKINEISGWGKRAGYGQKPALMIIDAQNKFTGIDKPILESKKVYPHGIGERAFRAMEKIKALADTCRKKDIPVVYTISLPNKDRYFNSFAKKRYPAKDASIPAPADGEEVPQMIEPQKGDIIVSKQFPSSFFCTPLISYLNAMHRDTLIVTGFVTSGCIRAFVVDGVSYNYNVIVAEDGVADIFDFVHEANLFDMDMKYADVNLTADILKYLEDNF